jgi:hypothetical protein
MRTSGALRLPYNLGPIRNKSDLSWFSDFRMKEPRNQPLSRFSFNRLFLCLVMQLLVFAVGGTVSTRQSTFMGHGNGASP